MSEFEPPFRNALSAKTVQDQVNRMLRDLGASLPYIAASQAAQQQVDRLVPNRGLQERIIAAATEAMLRQNGGLRLQREWRGPGGRRHDLVVSGLRGGRDLALDFNRFAPQIRPAVHAASAAALHEAADLDDSRAAGVGADVVEEVISVLQEAGAVAVSAEWVEKAVVPTVEKRFSNLKLSREMWFFIVSTVLALMMFAAQQLLDQEQEGRLRQHVTTENEETRAAVEEVKEQSGLAIAEDFVAKERVRLRSAPDLDSEVITTLTEGEHVTRLESAGEWYKVMCKGHPHGVAHIGWVASEYLIPVQD